MTRMLSVALLLTGCLTVRAADSSVFGFELGKPLSLPECPFKPVGTMRFYDPRLRVDTCYGENAPFFGGATSRTLYFSSKDAPSIVKDSRAFPLFSASGSLIGFQFATFGVASQSAVLDLLTAKYGKPTELSTSTAQNGFGAAFQVTHATWIYPDISVVFDGARTEINEGLVTVDLPEAAKLRADAKASQKRGKSI